jgi:hypothetical protein
MNNSARRLTSVMILAALFARGSARADPPQPATPLSVAAAAQECGLSAEAIVVANAQGSIAALVSTLESALSLRELLATTKALVDASALAVETAERNLMAAPTDETLQFEYTQALANLASLRSDLQEARDSLFTLATQQLTAECRDALLTWRNASMYAVPAEFRVLERTPEQWRFVEGALRAERRAERLQQPFEGEQVTMLAAMRADLDVIAADLRLNQHLANVQNALVE